jgi:hypothetical protein
MANWWRNALLILRYPMVICADFCSYLGVFLSDRNELIPHIVKRIPNANDA